MSSKRRLRRKSCAGKRRYATFQEAMAAVCEARQRTGDTIGPYRCRFARHFHIGHVTDKQRRAVAARGGEAAYLTKKRSLWNPSR